MELLFVIGLQFYILIPCDFPSESVKFKYFNIFEFSTFEIGSTVTFYQSAVSMVNN